MTIRDNSAGQALQNNYQTNASTMHFATTQGPSNQLFVAAGAGSRPATGTQKQVLQSTGEFIVPDLNQTNRVAAVDGVAPFRRGSARPKLPRVSRDFDEIEGIKAGSQEESLALTNSHGEEGLAQDDSAPPLQNFGKRLRISLRPNDSTSLDLNPQMVLGSSAKKKQAQRPVQTAKNEYVPQRLFADALTTPVSSSPSKQSPGREQLLQ